MINLIDLAYVRVGTADMRAQLDFAQDIVGLELVRHEGDTAMFRADNRHHCLAFVEGDHVGSLASAFVLAGPAELEAAAAQLQADGVEVTRGTPEEARARRVQDFISFLSPGDNRIELVIGQVHVEARPVRWARPAGITEFGHLGIEAPDVMEAHDFWTRHFNIKVSDWIGENAVLTRIDPVHHKLAIFKDSTGLGHVNFQVGSIDDVMRSWRFLEANGVHITMGPGRHPQSTAIFLYFKGPEDMTWEYSYGVRLIPDDGTWVPRHFDTAEPDFIDMWRGAVPAARRQDR
ncbi:2,3-dihydroxy-p-cumate/2,3-dihydroxybenzoate 3,4-dioxygenase [Raineyella antarctica]|uniref:2,3-dihydroxy-p-cumate/2,3-dihydroxybenzoate 3,4-dioxygenase n=1 Tax=Raineyella antarctica TaxID=1577474 RepID=A0A1G6GH45_9ACTN|nr:VOC family protein [Raineyella antarctica]SDB81274.1 2,3-dihydroxy-p-cumate/2,3-dihydroxybenzoate 3,4-dioxygenase [Raineyella antarctica]